MDQPNRRYGVYNQQTGQMPPQQEQQYEQQSPTYKDPKKTSEMINYRYSPEEMRVIQECEVEAMTKRALPLGFGLGIATYYGIQTGYLRPNPRYGAVPKVVAGVLLGYIVGRFSYQTVCIEKFMRLPNSRFAEMIRRNNKKYACRDKGSFYDSFTPASDAGVATALSLAPFQSATDRYSDVFEQPDALNLDTTPPNYGSLDDDFVPSMEGTNNLDDDLNIPPPKQVVTYDELRKKNREEYEQSRYRPGFGAAPPPPPQQQQLAAQQQRFPEQPPLRRQTDDEPALPRGPKNRYGDTWNQ